MKQTVIIGVILSFGFCGIHSPAFSAEPQPVGDTPPAHVTPTDDDASVYPERDRSATQAIRSDGDQSHSHSEPGDAKSPEQENTASRASPVPSDPFAFGSTVPDGDEFLPTSRAQVPAGIRVVAILHVSGQSPLAVLDIPGSHSRHLHYVREGDVIQIDAPAGSNPQSRAKGAGDSGTAGLRSTEHFYILISRISGNQVEVAPRTRPQEARILR